MKPTAKPNYKFIGLAPRVYAFVIDVLLYSFFIYSIKDVANSILDRQSAVVSFFVYLSIPQIFVLYIILFHSIWGQTLGKMVIKIKLYTGDYTEIGPLHAFSRESIVFVLQFVSLLGFFVAFQELPSYYIAPEVLDAGSTYVSDLIAAARERNPLNMFLYVSYAVWLTAIVVSMFRNKRKQSINDRIAGTVILKTNY